MENWGSVSGFFPRKNGGVPETRPKRTRGWNEGSYFYRLTRSRSGLMLEHRFLITTWDHVHTHTHHISAFSRKLTASFIRGSVMPLTSANLYANQPPNTCFRWTNHSTAMWTGASPHAGEDLKKQEQRKVWKSRRNSTNLPSEKRNNSDFKAPHPRPEIPEIAPSDGDMFCYFHVLCRFYNIKLSEEHVKEKLSWRQQQVRSYDQTAAGLYGPPGSAFTQYISWKLWFCLKLPNI